MGNFEQRSKTESVQTVLNYARSRDVFTVSDVVCDLPMLVAPEDAVRIATKRLLRPEAMELEQRIASGRRYVIKGLLRGQAVIGNLKRVAETFSLTDRGRSYVDYLDAREEYLAAKQRWQEAQHRKPSGTDSHHQA